MARQFMDDDMANWEAYVSGGQPGSTKVSRIFFLCLDSPMNRARYVEHDSGSVAEAERALIEMSDDDLRAVLADSVVND
ncbi:MAG: hypothetical protein ACE5FP_05270 [Gemmatimonadota bacterium]